MVISLRRLRRAWFWIKIVAALLLLALILPPILGWVRQLMYSDATAPPPSGEVLTPAGAGYGERLGGGWLMRLVRALRLYYRGP